MTQAEIITNHLQQHGSIRTFRAAGKRYGILNKPKEEEPAAEACYIDPATVRKVVIKMVGDTS